MGTRPLMETTATGASVAVLPDVDSLAAAAAAVILEEARRVVEGEGALHDRLGGGFHPQAGLPAAGRSALRGTHALGRHRGLLGRRAVRGPRRPAQQRAHGPRGPARPRAPAGREGASDAVRGAFGRRRGRGTTEEAAAQPRGRRLRSSVALQPSRSGDGIDLVLLGVGDNGHTASLFPGSAALDERERWAVAALEDPATAAATSGTGERLWRVTLTAPFINRAGAVALRRERVRKGSGGAPRLERRGRSPRVARPLDPARDRTAMVVAGPGGRVPFEALARGIDASS